MKYYKNIEKFVENKQVFSGMDVHESHWNICFYSDSTVLEKQRIPAEYQRLKICLEKYSTARNIQFVYEAGFSGFWLYRLLTHDGYNCIVTPASKMVLTGDKVKTDDRDAEKLALYLAADLLKSVYVPADYVESDRRVVRRRAQLVRKQTRAKNEIRSFLYLHGITRPEHLSKNWSKAFLAWLERLDFKQSSDKFTMTQLLQTYRMIRDSLAAVTRYIRQLSQDTKYVSAYKRITSLRGVGLITGMTLLLEINDFSRFKNSDHFGSYLGLTPSQYSSGGHVRLGHITRQGNAHLRRVLIESAWTVIRHEPVLRAKYERIKAKGNNGKKAIVAIARSLAIRLRRCLLDQTDYVVGVC
jgi:transposase